MRLCLGAWDEPSGQKKGGKGGGNGAASHVEDNFVEELQRVTQEHEWHNVPVDLAAQGCQIDWPCAVVGIPMGIEILPGLVETALRRVVNVDVDGLGLGLLCAVLV